MRSTSSTTDVIHKDVITSVTVREDNTCRLEIQRLLGLTIHSYELCSTINHKFLDPEIIKPKLQQPHRVNYATDCSLQSSFFFFLGDEVASIFEALWGCIIHDSPRLFFCWRWYLGFPNNFRKDLNNRIQWGNRLWENWHNFHLFQVDIIAGYYLKWGKWGPSRLLQSFAGVKRRKFWSITSI